MRVTAPKFGTVQDVSFGCTGQCGAFKTELLLHLGLNLGLSCSTTFNNELWTSMPPSASPLYAISPSFRNLFIKKLTPERVVPTISASVY